MGEPASISQDGLCASPSWAGIRHSWNLRQGHLAPEILEWLRLDPIFDPTSDACKAMKYTFTGSGKNYKTEEGRKMVISGSVGGASCSGSLCGLSLAGACPSSRVNAWFRAFRSVNAALPRAILQ